MTRRTSLRATSDFTITAIAKLAPRAHPEDVYGLGMEYVASKLGRFVDAPVPEVWLEPYESEPAALIHRIPKSLSWLVADKAVLPKIDNQGALATGLLLDIWLANFDRCPRNLLVQPTPDGTEFSQANSYAGWLIDHGLSGLLWASKFDPNLGPRDIKAVQPAHSVAMLDPMEEHCRRVMPTEYKTMYWALDATEQKNILDRIQGVPDDVVDGVIDEIPDAYMDEELREKTKILLKGRRDQIDNLVISPWP